MYFRKFSPIDRKYPIFELVDGEAVLLDVSKNDLGGVEIAFHSSIESKVFDLPRFESLIKEGAELAVNSTEA